MDMEDNTIILMGYQGTKLVHLSYWTKLDSSFLSQMEILQKICDRWYFSNDPDGLGELEVPKNF